MMLDLFSYATDEDLENNGTWKAIGGDTELLVARTGNRAYSNELTRLVDLNKDVIDQKDSSGKPTQAADEMSDSIMVDVIASTVLKGWRTKQADGSFAGEVLYRKKPLPFSPENAKLVLRHKDFRAKVISIANDIENYRLKEEVAQGEA